MLNRAPTLHRLGIQAFEPVLVEGKAISFILWYVQHTMRTLTETRWLSMYPCLRKLRQNARFLLLSPNNLLKPSDGEPVTVPSQDMVLGIYYLTIERENETGILHSFKSVDEAILAYENKTITLHEPILVKMTGINNEGVEESKMIKSTLGRFVFNEIIPQDLDLLIEVILKISLNLK